MGPEDIAVPQDVQERLAKAEQKRVFGVQLAMGVLQNELLMKLADSGSGTPGQVKAEQLRNRAITTIEKFLDTVN